MAVLASQRATGKLRTGLFWASLATTLCCCLLGAFHAISIRNEREVLLQSRQLISSLKTFGNSVRSSTLSAHGLNSKQNKIALTSLARTNYVAGDSHREGPAKFLSTNLFEKIKSAMKQDLGLDSKEERNSISLADGNVDADSTYVDYSQTGGNETNFDPMRNTVYVYAGREVKPHNTEVTAYILQSGFGVSKVGYINSASDADIRSAVWDDDCSVIIFPALKDIPDFSPNAVKDLKAFVSQGMHFSGTLLFLGSPVEVHLINELFGFDLQQDYKEGPYYKNGRYATSSIWNFLPYRARELGQTETLGFREYTLPPETKSYYDSFGDSVAACTRYDLGRVCYLAQDFNVLTQLPDLLQQAADSDPAAAADANARINSIAQATDTWLAMFEAMLLQSESDIAPQ